MGTSSGKPAKMHRYRDGGLAQVELWEPEVTALEEALGALRTALATRALPESCDVTVLGYDLWFDSLTRNQRHLDEWVGDVADEFIRAAGGDEVGPNETVTVPDSSIVVGFADRYESEAQARRDAAALDEILAESGIVHPDDLANDPDRLAELTGSYPELTAVLARARRFATDESYAAELVNTLGPQDVRTMADLVNTYGIAQDRGLVEDAYDDYVVPFAAILANADRSGRTDPGVRAAVFDMDATDEAPFDDVGDNFIHEGQLADMRYRSMALLLHAGDFSPQTTAEMADVLVHDGPVAPQFYDYSGFTDPAFLSEHRALAGNEWAAIAALERDDEAANIFFRIDDDEYPGELENLYIMNGGVGAETAARRLGLPVDEVAAEIDRSIADTVVGGLLEHPLAAGTTYSPETTELVARMIEAGGWEHMDAPDPVRAAMAEVTTPYSRDLAAIAMGEGQPGVPEVRLPGLDVDETDAFLREVSESEQGRTVLSRNAAALVVSEMQASASDIAADESTAGSTARALSGEYYAQIGSAWDDVQVASVERRAALVAGWQAWSDPVVDLVSGKIVEKIPVVNVAADLPLASNVVDGITGTLHDGINSAIYDNAIPEPEIESMETWADGAGSDIRTAVATTLYEDPAVRAHYLARARAEHPGVFPGLDAGDEMTFEDFCQISDVQDAVNLQSEGIITKLESSMAFDKSHD